MRKLCRHTNLGRTGRVSPREAVWEHRLCRQRERIRHATDGVRSLDGAFSMHPSKGGGT
jgi:hypothetical protein